MARIDRLRVGGDHDVTSLPYMCVARPGRGRLNRASRSPRTFPRTSPRRFDRHGRRVSQVRRHLWPTATELSWPPYSYSWPPRPPLPLPFSLTESVSPYPSPQHHVHKPAPNDLLLCPRSGAGVIRHWMGYTGDSQVHQTGLIHQQVVEN